MYATKCNWRESKKIDSITHKSLLNNYSEIEWKKVIGMRDVITHHYFDIDAEIIYDVCDNHLDLLLKNIKHIITELRKD